jgi:hypothetical protein
MPPDLFLSLWYLTLGPVFTLFVKFHHRLYIFFFFNTESDSDEDFSDSIYDYEFFDINDTNFPFSYLSKRSIFLIKPPQQ